MSANLENSTKSTELKKVNFHYTKTISKNVQTTTQFCSFHMLIKLILKILQARLQQYMDQELDVEAGLRKGRGTRD